MSEENFAFEWIDDVNRSPRYGYPFISINPTNRIMRIYISSRAMDILLENNNNEVSFIKAGVDIEKKLLAIKPFSKEENGLIKLNNGGSKKENSSCSFSSRPLINKIEGIIANKLKRYEVKYNDEMNILIADLSGGVEEDGEK